ncbi:unnamed protein product [Thelazia callipaeda]|uniref:Mannose-P-dolichol utilization defect 1 protein homolog n=1 Tax=Thelazia callipaeda TaxID=103827 RepID=A0A0N5CWB3_THECL|nr:unnamed protein product [Thelazia callipaeda]
MESLIASNIDALLHFLFPNDCYELVLLKYKFVHQECLSMFISRLLGIGITYTSLILFLPQILKIQLARSGKGISLLSQLLGLFPCFAISSYGYASGYIFRLVIIEFCSTHQWGDSFFVSIQMIIIIMQILWFSSRQTYALVFLAFCWTLSCAVMNNFVPLNLLALLQGIVIPFLVMAKVLQIRANYQEQSTGQLSLISVFFQFSGSAARIFTSWKETGDQLIIMNYLISAVLNGIIFSQFFIYWSNSMQTKKTA